MALPLQIETTGQQRMCNLLFSTLVAVAQVLQQETFFKVPAWLDWHPDFPPPAIDAFVRRQQRMLNFGNLAACCAPRAAAFPALNPNAKVD
jgi:hypothetical protein